MGKKADKVHQIILTIRVDVLKKDSIDIEEVVNELEYAIKDTTGKAEIVDTELCGFEESNY